MAQIQYPILQAPVPFAPFAETVMESKFHEPWSLPVRYPQDPRMSVVQAAASGNSFYPDPLPNVDPGNVMAMWWMPFTDPVRFPERLKEANQLAYAAPVNVEAEIISPVSAWYPPFSEPVRFLPRLETGLQKDFWFTHAPPYEEAVTEDRWHQPWSLPVRFPPDLGACRQQVSPDNPFGFTQPEAVLESKWHQPWSEPVRFPPDLGAARQPFYTLGWAGPYPETVTYAMWGFAWSEPVRFKPKLIEAAQEPFTFHPTPNPFVAEGWYNWLSEPVREPKRLGPGLNMFYAAPINVTPSVIAMVSEWFPRWLEPVRFKPGLHASRQSYFTMQIAPLDRLNPQMTIKNIVIRKRTITKPRTN